MILLSKREKRLQKIRQNPKNVSLEDLAKLLEDYGFWLDHVTGSHHIFRAEHGNSVWKLTIPYQKPIKIVYVRQALTAIDEIRQLQSEEDENGDDADERP